MRWLATLALAALLYAPPAALARTPSPGEAPSPGPGWQPRTSALSGRAVDYRQAELATIITQADAIQSLFRNVEALKQPEDFDVGGHLKWRSVVMGEQARSRREIFSYDYRLRFWGPSYKLNSEIADVIVVTVNPYPALLAGGWKPIVTDGESYEGEIFSERPKVESSIPGAVIYDQLELGIPSFTQVLFTAEGVSPWAPVSRERYLKAEIARFSEAESTTAEAYSQTSYERWVAGAAERKKTREEAFAMASQFSKENAEKGRAAMVQTEREVTEQLKANEAGEREQASKLKDFSIAPRLRTQLAQMSPAERAEQAILSGTELASFQFVPRETPLARPLVAYNPEFYRTRGSNVAVRAIVVYFDQDIPNAHNHWSDIGQAIFKTYRKLDWQALKRIVEPASR